MNKKLLISKIKILGIIFAVAVSFYTFNQSPCNASEGIVTPYYEQITKQYPSMEQYIADARKDVKSNWYPSSASFEHSATIVLTISKEGKLLNTYIASTSGDADFDNSLIIAAQKTTFAPLPDDVNEECVDIDMSFKMQRRNIFKK